jgi:dihydrofolate reductase
VRKDTGSARRIRYSVAMSLDGFIADRDGGYDWIVGDPAIDFAAYLAKIDTLIMGRGTYEAAQENPGGLSMFEEMDVYVVSTTLDPDDVADATLISGDVEARVRELKEEGRGVDGEGRPDAPGRDIWLFGGGVLFRGLLEAGLVDRVEVGVVPVLLGEGIPLLPGLGPAPGGRPPPVAGLHLHSAETFDSGMVLLKYDVERA